MMMRVEMIGYFVSWYFAVLISICQQDCLTGAEDWSCLRFEVKLWRGAWFGGRIVPREYDGSHLTSQHLNFALNVLADNRYR